MGPASQNKDDRVMRPMKRDKQSPPKRAGKKKKAKDTNSELPKATPNESTSSAKVSAFNLEEPMIVEEEPANPHVVERHMEEMVTPSPINGKREDEEVDEGGKENTKGAAKRKNRAKGAATSTTG